MKTEEKNPEENENLDYKIKEIMKRRMAQNKALLKILHGLNNEFALKKEEELQNEQNITTELPDIDDELNELE